MKADTSAEGGLQIVFLDVVRDPQRLRRDRQAGVDRRRRWKERGVDDEQIVHVVGAAIRIQHRFARVGPETERAALVRRVLVLV